MARRGDRHQAGEGGRRQPDCCTPHSGHTAVRSGSIIKPDPCADPSPELPPEKFSRRSEWVVLENSGMEGGVRGRSAQISLPVLLPVRSRVTPPQHICSVTKW